MKICIISGGSGSVQLKKGLSKYVPIENIYTLVNAYDNGLSTGLVRKVFNGDILGPSDIRKQQLLDYSNYRDDIKTESSEKLYSILKQRVTFLKNPKDEFLKIADQIHEYPIFKESIELFFEQPLSKKIKYIDFSIANIFYSSLMFQYGAQKTADIVADLLNLPKNIILNSDEVLYLGALVIDTILGVGDGSLVVTAIIGLAIFTAVYSLWGGLASVAWTDVLQVFLLVLGGLLTAFIALVCYTD